MSKVRPAGHVWLSEWLCLDGRFKKLRPMLAFWKKQRIFLISLWLKRGFSTLLNTGSLFIFKNVDLIIDRRKLDFKGLWSEHNLLTIWSPLQSLQIYTFMNPFACWTLFQCFGFSFWEAFHLWVVPEDTSHMVFERQANKIFSSSDYHQSTHHSLWLFWRKVTHYTFSL